MRTLLAFVLIIFSLEITAQEDLLEIRRLHQKAYENSDDAQFFADFMEDVSSENNTVEGYKAMSSIYLAKNGWNPFSRFAHFNDGKEVLEKAIENDRQNIELRFLRYTVQCNAPSFLDYSNNLEEDKTMILGNWSNLEDRDLKNRIRMYMLKVENLSATDKSIFDSEASKTKTASVERTINY